MAAVDGLEWASLGAARLDAAMMMTTATVCGRSLKAQRVRVTVSRRVGTRELMKALAMALSRRLGFTSNGSSLLAVANTLAHMHSRANTR